MSTQVMQQRIADYFKTQPVLKAWLFGSYIFGSVARDEQTGDSDVDVCYEGTVPSLLTLDKIQTELEQLFGCKVDMVRLRDNMNRLLRQRILRDGIYV